jgi:hypothetical protein
MKHDENEYFEKSISAEDLENDKDLLAELYELGWEHDNKPTIPQISIKPSSKPTVTPNRNNQSIDHDINIDHILSSGVDENKIYFTEDDENDQELLKDYAEIVILSRYINHPLQILLIKK